MKLFPLLRTSVFWFGLLAALPLWLACLSYFFLAGAFPILDALGILVPWLVGGNLVVLFAGLVLRSRRAALVSLVTLAVAFLSFGTIREFRPHKPLGRESGLHLMSFNVRHFSDGRYVGDEDPENRIARFIEAENPQIVCLQEFSLRKKKEFSRYPYQYLTPYSSGKTTQAIFSKFPITGRGEVRFPDTGNNALYADILIGPDTVRVYNIHLQSYNIEDRRFLLRNYGLDFIRRLNDIAKMHLQQARLVKEHLRSSPYPSILCGDLNATAYSRTYRILKKGMTDSFRERGSGWGITFYLSGRYPFRIDFILADERFEVLGHRNYPNRLSDHLPVSAWLTPAGEHPAIDGIGQDVDQQPQPE
ncbi:endonuclease/exonuclease/phosphatase family protein [Robiginitalea marina]|uniref:Endonuclease/exonuclease/phosphatase family protein n=1 Tax=Robiginitalea marina TaxID=2954105 RepID=A0ABT1AZH0_9FLAO|nr:endonuclease/exonuclease/phosphatase family protein [Robiginitalea marina]